MILPYQTLIRTGDLAKILGISSNTLIAWTNSPKDMRLRRCLFRKSYYSVQALRDAGILTAPLPSGEIADFSQEKSDVG